ncbi:hypothetical protein A8924_6107 [Saccharopolyspora erythraea NRRL 2338]|uniref:Secreted protein n=1 Tax=Saccharopolyspora erythraea TaxID=1836 RepID=A0ABN1C5J6_SACER|nr:hypothetical protein N599_22935 [Saccharopolyspora erythraea D]PFG98589.1 hypothetical protein A8924_6107 [Saccharopolyspora erythraea NRRL 2338]
MNVRAVLATLAVPVLIAVPAAGTTSAAAPTLTALDATFTVSERGSFDTYGARVAALDGLLEKAPVDTVFGEANRDAVDAGAGSCPAGIPAPDASWFCWYGAQNDPPNDDAGTENWMPQGITGSWDAAAGGGTSARGLLVSWYDAQNLGKGVRISFVDNSDPANVRYRHALLVEPTAGDDFRGVTVPDGKSLHAGGIAWVGHHLYVVDTDRGVRVFDLDHIWRTAADPSKSKIGNDGNGNFHAFDYRFVIPQVGEYTQDGTCVRPAPNPKTDPLCWSYVGVDHSSNSLVTGEYISGKPGGRVVHWPIDETTGRLVTGGGGAVSSVAAYQTSRTNVQGATSHDGTFWLSSSTGRGNDGQLHRTRVGQSGTTSATPTGPEDLSFDPASGDLWSVSEWPELRVVFRTPNAAG